MPAEQHLTLAVDVGNTRIKFGVFDGSARAGSPALLECLATCAVPVGDVLDLPHVMKQLAPWHARLKRAVVAGVHPPAIANLLSRWPGQAWPAAVTIDSAAELPLRVDLEHPDGVGIDRLLEAVAANLLRHPDEPAIVIASGTATTIDLVSTGGAFKGGAILPGLDLGARALHQYTALLPRIEVSDLFADAVSPLGKNTCEAIKSGLLYGQIGAIRELTARLSESARRPPLQLITGGNGQALAAALGQPYRFESELALRGLAWVGRERDACSS